MNAFAEWRSKEKYGALFAQNEADTRRLGNNAMCNWKSSAELGTNIRLLPFLR